MNTKRSTIDKDLDKIVSLENATKTVSSGLVAHTSAFIFLVAAGFLGAFFAGVETETTIIVFAADAATIVRSVAAPQLHLRNFSIAICMAQTALRTALVWRGLSRACRRVALSPFAPWTLHYPARAANCYSGSAF